MKKMFTLLLFALRGMNLLAQTCGPYDPSFGNGGIAYGYSTTGSNYPGSRNIIMQPDNKIIQVGTIPIGNNSTGFGLIRYNSNGTLDSAFGTNGRVVTSIGVDSYTAAGALQADGKIVVTGVVYSTGNADFVLVRYNSNGSLDSTFGQGGKAITPVGLHDDYAYGLSIQQDGKIVVVGSSGDNSNAQAFAVARFKTNGSLDSTFGQNGKVVKHIGHFITFIGNKYYGQYAQEYANIVAIQNDGKIVMGGQSYTHAGCEDYYGSVYCNPMFAMVRYNPDGSLDSTFGSKGKVTDSLLMYNPTAGVLQTDGKIVVTGSGNQNGFITERYNSDGSLDNSFGTGGKTVTNFNASGNGSSSNAVAIQPDGKIVVAGNVFKSNSGSDFAVVRYKTDGSLDNTFNVSGFIQFHIGESKSYDYATGVAVQGSRLLVGGAIQGNNDGKLVIVGLLDNIPALPVAISANGALTFCQGASVQLTSSVSGSLQWYKNNVLISGATSTAYIATTSGSYIVEASNSSGCGISAPAIVTVNTNPPKPFIGWDGSQFSTNAGYAQYQWLLNDTAIAGATGNTHKPVKTGLFKVRVTDNANCSSISDSFNLVVTAVADITIGDANLRYYPNPVKNILHIEVAITRGGKLAAELYDLTGRLIQKQLLNQTHNQMPVQQLPTGVYQLLIYNNVEKNSIKILVIK